VVKFGKVPIYLYSQDDLVRIRQNLEDRTSVRLYKRTPRSSKYTTGQKHERSKLVSQRYYWRTVRDDAEFYSEKTKYWRAIERLKEVEEQIEAIEAETE
jgi:hypothetical protein